jgi:hypothetical protein
VAIEHLPHGAVFGNTPTYVVRGGKRAWVAITDRGLLESAQAAVLASWLLVRRKNLVIASSLFAEQRFFPLGRALFGELFPGSGHQLIDRRLDEEDVQALHR